MSGGTVQLASAQQTYTVVPAVPQMFQPTGRSSLVTLDVRDSTVAYVVSTLVHQSHLRLVYTDKDPVFAKRVTVHIDKIPLMDALATALQGTGLEANPAEDGETIVIRERVVSQVEKSKAANGIVAGQVTDSATGKGIENAQVQIVGEKTLSCVTDQNGRFILRDIPVGKHVLHVRLFGYRLVDRRVIVNDSKTTTVHIIMVSAPTILSGVVTTATGKQQKLAVGNDITTINVDSVMQIAPVTSVTDLLETRVPGLTVMHSDGVPGDPSRLRLRGAGSVQLNNDPVVIVDGVRVYSSQSDSRNLNLAPTQQSNTTSNGRYTVSPLTSYAAPSPLDQIDPNSIETIEVFKGPSASAIYGSDAANGVIVITTKHGRAGPTHWTLGLGAGVNSLPGNWPVHYYRFGSNPLGSTYVAGASDQSIWNGLCLWVNVDCNIDSVVAYQALNDPRYTVFSRGYDQTANLTISGGVSALQYSLSASSAGDVGNLKLPVIEKQRYEQFYGEMPYWMQRPDKYKNWGLNGQLTANPNPTMRVTMTSSLYNSTQQHSSLEQAISQLQGEYINETTIFSPYNSTTYSLGTNPLIANDVERATDHQFTVTDALTLSWRPYTWLPISATVGINTIQRTDITYIPYGVNYAGAGACITVSNTCAKDTTGSYGLGRGTSQNNSLGVGTVIPLSHLITLAVGGNYHSASTNDFTAYTEVLSPGVIAPTSFIAQCPGTGNQICSKVNQQSSAASTYGWYVEPRLNFHSRFFVAPGFRFDGGSAGTHASYNTGGFTGGLSAFPKIDFSWVAVDRQATSPLFGVLTLLRPRVAIGLAGIQPGPADKLRLFNVGSYRGETGTSSVLTGSSCVSTTVTLDGGGTTVPAVCLNSLGNTQLRPERSRELEGGFDATLWQGRLTLTYTQYNKTRKDAILSIPIAPSVISFNGNQANIQKNIGVIENTGTEITFNAYVFQRRSFTWNVGANFSKNNNQVVRLNPGQAPFCLIGGLTQGGRCVVPGYPLFSNWSRPIVFFADANQDGVIMPEETRLADSAVFVGQPDPKYLFNFNSGLTLLNGQLSLNASFAYQNGLTQTNEGIVNSNSLILLAQDPNTTLATQAAIAASCFGNGTVFSGHQTGTGGCSDLGYVQTVNTFRFNNLSVNYIVPEAFSSLLRVPRMSIALQGGNLALHTNYRGKDPNVNAFSTVQYGDATLDQGQIPQPRTWWLKVRLGN